MAPEILVQVDLKIFLVRAAVFVCPLRISETSSIKMSNEYKMDNFMFFIFYKFRPMN